MTAGKFVAALLVTSGVTIGMTAPMPVIENVSNAAMTAFGRSVAIAGDFAFVGEPNVGGGGRGGRGGGAGAPSGIVHVFRAGPAGWKPAGELSAPNSSGGDGFGMSLAAEGATLLVGQIRPAPAVGGGGGGGRGGRGGQQPAAPPPPDTAVGTVQIFKRGADMKWTAAGALTSAAAPGGQFGYAIALAGDRAIVGAPGEAEGGSVYVFARAKDGAWSAAGKLPAQGIVAGDRFGAALAIDGQRVVVGAPARKGKGAAFSFRDSSGTWLQETEQVAPPAMPANAQLGASVAVKGDRFVAGAPGADFTPAPANPVRDSLLAALPASTGSARESIVNALAAMNTGRGGRGGGRGGAQFLNSGMVLAYQRASFGSWRMVGTLAPFDFGSSQFGAALGMVGNELWIGAPGSDGAGRIYRAQADKDGMWTAMTKLGVDSIETGAQWAATFAVSGSRAVIGMPGDGAGGGTVAFMKRSSTGNWSLASLNMPPVNERFSAIAGKEVQCDGGKAGSFECNGMNIMSYMPISAIGGKRGVRLSGSWGWTDPVTGHDISIVGRTDGAAFIDVTNPTAPRYLGDLIRTKGASMSSWREIKTYKNYALIVSDGSGDHHGIQIFDLTRLRNVTTPRHFTEDAHFDAGSIHDIAVNEKSGFAYAVGTASGGERCGGGLLMIDMRVPLKPSFAGCFADVGTGRARTGYTHDVQCVTYHGPDKRYTDHEICMAANETTVSIQDVTDKKNVKVIAHADYPTVGYTHQGWFTEDQRYWYLDDELDEEGNDGAGLGKSAQGTRTMIFDLQQLDDPILVQEYIGSTHAIDHNQYVKGDRLYQSNYLAGLRVLDISDPRNPKEIGHFDTTPGENVASFGGAWNVYPFFKNGTIGISSMGEGFFVIKDVARKVMQ